MPFATNDGVRLHWGEQGSGDAVLLIMGHLFPAVMWYPVLPALTAGHRVVWFDNRGTGESDAPRTATVHDLAADARAVMDAAGLDRAHVWGVSMGGGIAVQLAYESPERVRSLVLGCTAMKSGTYEAPRLRGPFLGTLPYRIPRRLALAALRKSLYGPAATPAAIERDLEVLATIRYSPRGVYAQDMAIAAYDMTPDQVSRLEMAALVQHGTADQAVPFREGVALAETLPHARLITYEGAGHNYIVDIGEQVTADVLAFWKDDAGRPG